MKQEKSMLLLIELILLAAVLGMSLTFMRDVYLFGWAAHNWSFYLFLSGLSVVLFLMGKVMMSILSAVGITFGLFLGQYLGDLLVFLTKSRIHYGFVIWIVTILIFVIAGTFLEKRIVKFR